MSLPRDEVLGVEMIGSFEDKGVFMLTCQMVSALDQAKNMDAGAEGLLLYLCSHEPAK